MDLTLNLQSALGLIAFPLIALLFCKGTRQFNARIWLAAVGLQLILALIFLKVPWFQALFGALNQGVLVLQEATAAGTSFVFGYLGGGPLPFQEVSP